MAMPTLLDIAKANGSDAVVGLVEEVIKAHPEISMGAARTIRGLNFKTLVRTGLPTVGFRSANEGYAASVSTFENRLVEAYTFNPRWECDKAVADRYEDGASAYIAIEAAGIMEASMNHLCSQFYYGTSNDAKGFPGLLAAYDSTNMVVDATGTTADTGSSVWAVRFGPRAVSWVWGNNGQLAMGDVLEQRILDGSSNPYTAYCQELLSYVGLQVASKYAVGRIKKLTADSGKGLTDSLLSQLYEKFPVGQRPEMFLASRRSIGQLQRSRTATNPTGAPVPVPDSWNGIPIMATDAIVDTESLSL